MEKKEIIKKTEQTICMLYQNREIEAIKNVTELLPLYQELVQEMYVKQEQERTLAYLQNLKELVECYKEQDMLGMADKLREYLLPMMQ